MTLKSVRISLACFSLAVIAACLVAAQMAGAEMVRALSIGDAATALRMSGVRSQFATIAIWAMSASAGAVLTLLYLRVLHVFGARRSRHASMLAGASE